MRLLCRGEGRYSSVSFFKRIGNAQAGWPSLRVGRREPKRLRSRESMGMHVVFACSVEGRYRRDATTAFPLLFYLPISPTATTSAPILCSGPLLRHLLSILSAASIDCFLISECRLR